MTLDDLMEAFDDPAVIIKPSKFNDFDIYEKGTDKWIATVSIERGIICVANKEGNLQFPVKDLNKAIDKTYRSFNESCEFSEAKELLESAGYRVLEEDADEPASKKQLWALFCIYKKDFRNQGLTKGEASELIKKGASERPAKSSGKSLDKQICEHIETYLKPKLDKEMNKAFGMQSVVGDADLEGNLIPGRKRYKFFGGGCGFAWIKYDKRNKKLGEIIDKYEDIYRNKYWEKFADEYIKIYKEKEMGAVLSQDLNIKYAIQYAILNFAESIGINVGKAYVDGRLD